MAILISDPDDSSTPSFPGMTAMTHDVVESTAVPMYLGGSVVDKEVAVDLLRLGCCTSTAIQLDHSLVTSVFSLVRRGSLQCVK